MTQQSSHWARSAPTIRVGVLGLLAALLLVLPLALASRAEAFIYWAGIDSIGRANLDGTGVDQNFILTVDPRDIAVDGEHIYWTTASGIGRAKLDGTDVEPSFIPSVGDAPLRSVAVDAGHLYWSYYSCPGGNQRCTGAIARANLDGTGVDRTFIDAVNANGLAVDPNFLYWTDFFSEFGLTNPPVPDTIGRANLDGTGVETNFITPPSSFATHLLDIAVDSGHIYWTRPYESIGRANLDGTGVEQRFIPTAGVDIAVDDHHVYWTHGFTLQFCPPTAIGRGNLDGTGVDSSFIEVPCGATVAVDSLTDTKLAGKASAVRTQRQTGKKIVVKVNVKARERLTAKASGEIKVNPTYKVRPNEGQVAAGETKTLRLKPKKAKAKKIARALKRGEKAKARVEVKLTDLAGNRETEKLRVRLKR